MLGLVCICVGISVGASVFSSVGSIVGSSVGNSLGTSVGSKVGSSVGKSVCSSVGSTVGESLGFTVDSVGTSSAEKPLLCVYSPSFTPPYTILFISISDNVWMLVVMSYVPLSAVTLN